MLIRVRGGYEVKEEVTLTEGQQERFEAIRSFPAGFIPDYEAYITDGSFPDPDEVDEEGNKRDLSKHPLRDLMIDRWQHLQDADLEAIIEVLEGE